MSHCLRSLMKTSDLLVSTIVWHLVNIMFFLAVITTGEGRRSVMKLGERMTKSFNEMLTMSGKVDFPQQSKCGVRISIRMNTEPGQPSGLVICAASCLSVPITPLEVFNRLRDFDNRKEVLILLFFTYI